MPACEDRGTQRAAQGLTGYTAYRGGTTSRFGALYESAPGS